MYNELSLDCAAVGQVTPTMLEKLRFGTFIFFGAFSMLGGIFIWFFVPETKGLTLEEMDDVFGATEGLAAAERVRQDAIFRRLGLVHDSEPASEKGRDEESADEKVQSSAA